MNRRLAALVVAALVLVGLAWWARARDGATLPVPWAPPRLAVGRDQGAGSSLATPRGPEVEYGVVACTVEAALGDDPGQLVARNEDGGTAMSVAADRVLNLQLPPGEWQINWHGGGTGHAAQLRRIGMVDVVAGEVQRCTVPASGWSVSGEVRDKRGEPRVGDVVEGCGGRTETDEAGRFLLRASRGDCLIRAWAADGLLSRPSEPLYFDPFDPPVSATLRVDAGEIGGVGLGLRGSGDGLHISMVAPGTPAEAAGLQIGDVIVAVDGAPAAGWSVVRGIEAITGEPGTRVRLRVEGVDGDAEHDLIRTRLGEPASVAGDTGDE